MSRLRSIGCNLSCSSEPLGRWAQALDLAAILSAAAQPLVSTASSMPCTCTSAPSTSFKLLESSYGTLSSPREAAAAICSDSPLLPTAAPQQHGTFRTAAAVQAHSLLFGSTCRQSRDRPGITQMQGAWQQQQPTNLHLSNICMRGSRFSRSTPHLVPSLHRPFSLTAQQTHSPSHSLDPPQHQHQQPHPPKQDPPSSSPSSQASSPAIIGVSTLQSGTGFKKTFYKRHLPSPPAIAFASPEGRQLLAEALAAGTMSGFFKLVEQFSTQDEPAFCGLTSLSMVLNALSIDPRRTWKGAWRWFHEGMLDCCRPLDAVRREGITLVQAAVLARCNGARVDIRRHGTFTEEEFRQQVEQVCTSGEEHLVLSYSRRPFGQTGDGHFSPVGGYHRARDLVLILDVARFKYPPHWVPLHMLYESMSHLDPMSGLPRGYLLMSAHHMLDSAMFTLDVRQEGWQQASSYTGALPDMLQQFLTRGAVQGGRQKGGAQAPLPPATVPLPPPTAAALPPSPALVAAVQHLLRDLPLDSAMSFVVVRQQAVGPADRCVPHGARDALLAELRVLALYQVGPLNGFDHVLAGNCKAACCRRGRALIRPAGLLPPLCADCERGPEAEASHQHQQHAGHGPPAPRPLRRRGELPGGEGDAAAAAAAGVCLARSRQLGRRGAGGPVAKPDRPDWVQHRCNGGGLPEAAVHERGAGAAGGRAGGQVRRALLHAHAQAGLRGTRPCLTCCCWPRGVRCPRLALSLLFHCLQSPPLSPLFPRIVPRPAVRQFISRFMHVRAFLSSLTGHRQVLPGRLQHIHDTAHSFVGCALHIGLVLL